VAAAAKLDGDSMLDDICGLADAKFAEIMYKNPSGSTIAANANEINHGRLLWPDFPYDNTSRRHFSRDFVWR